MTVRETLIGLRDRASSPKLRAEYEEGLACPLRPPALDYLWGWFLELDAARGGGEMGPSPIGYPDILAWCRLRRIRLTGWELELLVALDGAWLAAQGEKGGRA